jgi:hypothetical protein
MSVSACEPCSRFFVLDPEHSSGCRCSSCGLPLRLLTRPEYRALTARLHAEAGRSVRDLPAEGGEAAAVAGPDKEIDWLQKQILAFGRSLEAEPQEILAESEDQLEEAERLRLRIRWLWRLRRNPLREYEKAPMPALHSIVPEAVAAVTQAAPRDGGAL